MKWIILIFETPVSCFMAYGVHTVYYINISI